MTRSIVSGLLGLLSVIVVGSLPVACQSGGVGDPCTPEDEYDPQFAGFKVTEENIESRSFQCQTRICLVNHFQGRVSCPLGQDAPKPCDPAAPACAAGEKCSQSAVFAPDCDKNEDCASKVCNPKSHTCECTDAAAHCPGEGSWSCVAIGKEGGRDVKQCQSFVCNDPNKGCQQVGASGAANKGKACCVPGTDTPVQSSVCGQCADDSNRNAEQAVYCSCRCGVANGEPDDPDFNFCQCPTGFSCEEIRPDVGLGDKQITGKYCIKDGSKFAGESQCGKVNGFWDSKQCKGIGAL